MPCCWKIFNFLFVFLPKLVLWRLTVWDGGAAGAMDSNGPFPALADRSEGNFMLNVVVKFDILLKLGPEHIKNNIRCLNI